MLRSFLAGAGLGALLDAWTMLPLPDIARLPREYALLTLAGTMVAALAFVLVLRLALKVPIFARLCARLEERGAFLPGLVFGLVPASMGFLPEHLRGVLFQMPTLLSLIAFGLPAVIVLLLPLSLPRKLFGPQAMVHHVLLALVPIGFVVAYLRPSAVPPGFAEAPAYPEAKRLEHLGGLKAAPTETLPDLVLVSIDTLRTDLRRDEQSVLPTLEALRAEGWWHAEGYSTSNQTVPGHVGMLSGLAPEQHMVGQNAHSMVIPSRSADEKYPGLLAEVLEREGYRTAGVVSNAMAEPFYPGYQSWDNTRARYGKRFFFMRTTGRTTWFSRLTNMRRAQDWIARWLHVEDHDLLPPGMSKHATDQALAYHAAMAADSERPLHLFVHYMDPHSPYFAPESTLGVFSEGQELPEMFQRWTDDHRKLINRVRATLRAVDEAGDDPRRAKALEAAALMHAWYDEEILALDADLARLLGGIRERGRPTLVIITSDHGEHFGENSLMEHSNSLYEELVRVPFVAVGLNGFELGAGELPGPPSIIDVVPTMLSAAGRGYVTSGSLGLRGANLLDAEQRAELAERSVTMSWTQGNLRHVLAVAQGDRKLIAEVDPPLTESDSPTVRAVEAFDLAQDAAEGVNLLASGVLPEDFEGLMRELERAAMEWQNAGYFADRDELALSASKREEMAALGYLDE